MFLLFCFSCSVSLEIIELFLQGASSPAMSNGVKRAAEDLPLQQRKVAATDMMIGVNGVRLGAGSVGLGVSTDRKSMSRGSSFDSNSKTTASGTPNTREG